MFSARSPWRRTSTTASVVLLAAALLPAAPARADGGEPLVLPAAGLTVHHLALSAGSLAVAAAAPAAQHDTVLTYGVTISPATGLVALPAANDADTAPAVPIARSGIRAAHAEATTGGRYDVVIEDPTTTQVRIAGALAAGDRLQLAGPYTLAGSTVYGPRGVVLAQAAPGLAAALDGQRLVWADPGGAVRVRDLQLPQGTKNPRVIAETGCTGGCVLSLAAAGDTVAMARSDAAGVDLRSLTGATLGRIETGSAPQGLQASTAAVTWLEGDVLRYSPLDAPAPATLATVATAAAPVLDDNLAAWVDQAGDVRIVVLPGVAPGPPQLLGTAARAAFSPDGDTAGDTWLLPIWSSKRLFDARITLTGPAGEWHWASSVPEQASELALPWDGSSVFGARAADGVYTWTLDALAVDGSGPLLAADGSRPTGLVTVAAHSPGPFAAPPAVSSGHAVQGAWGVAAPRFGLTARYDVRVRGVKAGAPGGVKIPSSLAGRTVLSATAATRAALVTGAPPGSLWQVSVRATDSAGNSSPWSPWRGTRVG